jgi:2-methylcitrate dehydratase
MRETGTGPVDSLQERIADYAEALRYDSLPAETIAAAKTRIADTFAALVAGFSAEPSQIARRAARVMGAGSDASIVGTAERATVEMAAFANATASRYAELNDTYHWPGASGGHPSDMILPLFNIAEFTGSTGSDLIAAVVLAYELYLRISDQTKLPGFDQTNFALIGTAAGAGKLLGLSGSQMRHCLSMAVVPNCALLQARVDDLSMWKAVAAGQAGKAAITAARFALEGMEGPFLPFEGTAGWLDHVAHGRFKLDELGGDRVPFKIGETIIKRRACCGTTISTALAAEDAYAKLQGIDSGTISKVIVETYKMAHAEHGLERHHWTPTTRETADHSVPFVAAVALRDGHVGPGQFDEVHLADPEVRAVLNVLECVENPDFTRQYDQTPVIHRTSVKVTTSMGAQVVGESGGPFGDIGDPFTRAELEQKFSGLTEEFLGPSRSRAALEQLWGLDELTDLREVAQSLTP